MEITADSFDKTGTYNQYFSLAAKEVYRPIYRH